MSCSFQQGAQVSRLEKADILEMTVKYLRHVQKQQVSSATMGCEPEVAAKFSAGYTECATEVIRYMDQAKCVTSDIRTRLESYLVERLRDAVNLPPASPPESARDAAIQQQQQQLVAPERETSALVRPSSRSSLITTHPVSNVNSEHGCIQTAAPSASNIPAAPALSTTISDAVSPAATARDEYSRHYQTAVDLANMAAGVILPAKTSLLNAATTSFSLSSSASSSFSKQRTNPDPARCKSISPGHESKEKGKARKRFNSTESAITQPLCNSTKNNDTNTAFVNNNALQALERLQPETFNPHLQTMNEHEKNHNQQKESYLRSFQRPLHIDIPEATDSTLYTSTVRESQFRPSNPSKILPVISPSPASPNDFYAPNPSSSPPASSSSSSATTIYNYPEDAPPTLLYAYNYNLPQRPSNEKHVSNSPKMNYSLVVYQPGSDVTASPITDSAIPTHDEKFHATFALEQRPGLNNAANFYCASKSSASQGQEVRTTQHPAAMNAPITLFPTQTSMAQPQEFAPQERLDVNNNSSFYGSHQFHCPTFAVSSPGDRSLRKDSTCPQIPSGFYDHNNIAIPDNSIKLAPAELSSNLVARFHGNPQICTSALSAPHPPHPATRRSQQGWGNQSPVGQTLPSNEDTHCVNSLNNGDQQDSYSMNGQSSSDPPAPQPHQPHSPHAKNSVHQSSVPSSSYSSSITPPYPSPPQDNSRPALKKHLLFGQRSEMARRHCHNTAADDSHSNTVQQQTPVSSRHSDYQYHHEQTRTMTGGEQHRLAARGSGALSLSSLSSACVSSAKRPCLEPVRSDAAHREVLTSGYRGGHGSDERLVWRPW